MDTISQITRDIIIRHNLLLLTYEKNIYVYKFYPTLVILSLITTDSLSTESSKLEYFRISEGFQLEYCLNLGIGLIHVESSLFQVATLISIYYVN